MHWLIMWLGALDRANVKSKMRKSVKKYFKTYQMDWKILERCWWKVSEKCQCQSQFAIWFNRLKNWEWGFQDKWTRQIFRSIPICLLPKMLFCWMNTLSIQKLSLNNNCSLIKISHLLKICFQICPPICLPSCKLVFNFNCVH